MSTTAAPPSTREQLETAILADVVTQFANLGESTSRFSLLVKYEGRPAWQAIGNLTSRNMLRKSDFNQATNEELYLPTASAFEFCGNPELQKKAKTVTTIVLHTLKQMFKGERKREGFTFEDFQRHVNDIYPNNTFAPSDLKLGLYLAKDFNVLSAFGSDVKEVCQFQIAETAIGMADPDAEWDRVMATLNPRLRIAEDRVVTSQSNQWERISVLAQREMEKGRSPLV
jgi:hypothetical protein